jgi:hypothetical protein
MQRKYRSDNYRQHNNRENYDAGFEQNLPHKKYSKGMILLKSSVFAMFIVLVVMVAAYEIVKRNKDTFTSSTNVCNKNAEIKIAQGVESIKEHDGVVIIVTKAVEGKQEVIRVDASCGVELSRLVIGVN